MGLLKDKTRVLITHQEFVLPYSDKIVVLEEGRIAFQGTYSSFCEFSLSQQSLCREIM